MNEQSTLKKMRAKVKRWFWPLTSEDWEDIENDIERAVEHDLRGDRRGDALRTRPSGRPAKKGVFRRWRGH